MGALQGAQNSLLLSFYIRRYISWAPCKAPKSFSRSNTFLKAPCKAPLYSSYNHTYFTAPCKAPYYLGRLARRPKCCLIASLTSTYLDFLSLRNAGRSERGPLESPCINYITIRYRKTSPAGRLARRPAVLLGALQGAREYGT